MGSIQPNIRLLPHAFRLPGLILLLIGVVMLFFWFRLDLRITAPVPALVSIYAETRWFRTFQSNIADELMLISLLAGFFLLIFSREKDEKATDMRLRMEAMFRAAKVHVFLMLFAVLFFYGSAFTGFLLFNLFALSLLYLSFYHSKRIRDRRQEAQAPGDDI